MSALKKAIKNSLKNMSAIEPRNTTTAGPKYCNTAESHEKRP